MSAYNMSTDAGRVRLLIPDLSLRDPGPIFTDDEIDAFLAIEGSNVRRAAATALDVIASSEVMTSKVIKTQDLQTDGAKVAAELRARAKSLREQADEGYGAEGDDDTSFTIVDFDPYGDNTTWVC